MGRIVKVLSALLMTVVILTGCSNQKTEKVYTQEEIYTMYSQQIEEKYNELYGPYMDEINKLTDEAIIEDKTWEFQEALSDLYHEGVDQMMKTFKETGESESKYTSKLLSMHARYQQKIGSLKFERIKDIHFSQVGF